MKHVIHREDLIDLLRDRMKLEALEAGGVDNWDWYEASLIDCGYFDDDGRELEVEALADCFPTVGA
ncbi:hypothetical protein QE342_gp133 [Pseudomonas phage vB_PaeS_B8]|uniref:Uncharacterized protein n=10 Tax=Viruses TaxID=10239 RepID=A0A291LBR1_9CAUD|nr:hypothetical protein AU075_gp131 [Pseudomonas phage C11]YP_009200027.1 hypothetical protein K8_091 [Pseudomonas phage K8]YP_009273845.1 hypothetical protein BH773_gp138 [Pseudomonas phage K5]YP_009291151.1 hypothetical protein BI047_gp107 [Pseudomonas phage phiMK]YP_009623496.1 hypothetical protein FDJ38_gp137 [Pseudomonas phage vB_PaeM_C2-10_Ab02]YP_010763510.1 hypothetical protein QE330_gp040 [Pseudomonas phage vB_Pae_Kat]YP_010763688.1 hypothetical protein QE331_gp148 [Pseudomonas phage